MQFSFAMEHKNWWGRFDLNEQIDMRLTGYASLSTILAHYVSNRALRLPISPLPQIVVLYKIKEDFTTSSIQVDRDAVSRTCPYGGQAWI